MEEQILLGIKKRLQANATNEWRVNSALTYIEEQLQKTKQLVNEDLSIDA